MGSGTCLHSRNGQLSRALSLIGCLTNSRVGHSARDLAKMLDTGLRNIYRDIDAIERVGLRLIRTADWGRRGWGRPVILLRMDRDSLKNFGLRGRS